MIHDSKGNVMAKRTRMESAETDLGTERGPGRPPGAKNADYPNITRTADTCPYCGCTDAVQVRSHLIPTPDSSEFTHVRVIICECKHPDCHRRRRVLQRENPV